MVDLALLVVPNPHDLIMVPGLRNLHDHHFLVLRVVAAAEAAEAVKAVEAVAAIAVEADPVAKTTGTTAKETKARHAAVRRHLRRKYVQNG